MCKLAFCRYRHSIFVVFIALNFTGCQSTHQFGNPAPAVNSSNKVWEKSNTDAFEKKLESLRKRRHLPSFSAGIVNEKKLVWKESVGYADVENKIKPTENTVYQLASITKTFGAIILMQQVEAGRVSLDDPIAKYGINLGARWGSDERIKIKHLVTHTAQGNSWNIFKPGYSFRYNGNFYDQIKLPIEKTSGKTFGELALANIIQPIGIKTTVPNIGDTVAFGLTGYDRSEFEKKIAKPYQWRKGELQGVAYRDYFGPAAGLMSSVADLAVYSVAIDEKEFLSSESWNKIFTPALSEKGKPFPYGIGWFIRYYKGTKVVWHTGLWDGCSALFVKIPEKDLAFIILANSPDLSNNSIFHFLNPFSRKLSRNLKASPFGKAFLARFTEL
jgi:CubicO group peptidase (beta-lactamase class C family)